MRRLDVFRLHLRTLFHKRRIDRDLEDELQYHLERHIAANLEAGMPPEQARAAALRAIGGVAHIQEECRDERGLRWLEDLAQDLRYAARSMRRSPAIAMVAV